MTTTTNLALKKPDADDFYNVDDFNENADIIDTAVAKMAGDISGKAPANHTHSATDVTGLAAVATSGKYSDLSGKPTSLPANGGNADTVDNKHAIDIMNMGNFAVNRTTIEENTDLDTMRVGGKFVVNSKTVAGACNNSPFTESGYYFDVVRHSSDNIMQIATLWSGKTKIRYYGGTWSAWVNIADGGNAATVNGKAVNFNFYTDPAQFGKSLIDTPIDIWRAIPENSIFMKETSSLTDSGWAFPSGTSLHTLTIAKVSNVRPAGIFLFPKVSGNIYYALIDNNANFVSTWYAINDGGNAATAQKSGTLATTASNICLRNLSSGTAAATTANCPAGAWYGKHG